MARNLNSAGMAYARSLISAGKVSDGAWSFNASDGNSLLGSSGDDWANFGKNHLAVNTEASEGTKDRYSYPFAKGGTLYKSALNAIRSRASQQGDTSIFNAAGDLLDSLGGDSGSKSADLEAMMFGRSLINVSAELKFVGEPDSGMIEGYGSVFGVQDSHGDMVMPGAFDATLAEHKARGALPHMYGEHSFAMLGGDPYPIGVWNAVEPDGKGLLVKGQLVALEHPDVRRIHELMKKGVVRGLSIAWKGREGGIQRGKEPGEPRRYLKSVDLYSIDPVVDPSNAQARIDGVKQMTTMPHTAAAATAVSQAHQMCVDCMTGGDAPTADERNQITGKLKEAYRHLTGEDMPIASKSKPNTIREFESFLRELGFSTAEARTIAERGFKSSTRDEEGPATDVVRSIADVVSGFSLPRIGG